MSGVSECRERKDKQALDSTTQMMVDVDLSIMEAISSGLGTCNAVKLLGGNV